MSRRIIVLHEEWELILKRLDYIKEAVRIRQKLPEHTLFNNQELLQILNVSKRAAQEWRNQNIITISQIVSKIYYTMTDIPSKLSKYYKPSKEQDQCLQQISTSQ